MTLLLEAKREELLRKGKNEDPKRFARRINYVNTIKPEVIAKDLFMHTGTLTIPVHVGDYIVTIHFSNVMKEIRHELAVNKKTVPDRPLVYKALRKAIDTSNIYIDCTCPDFRYRFAYWSTKKRYKYGNAETRPSKITNPNNKGYACKHCTAALIRPSQILKYAAGWVSTVVRAYIEDKLDIDLTTINDPSTIDNPFVYKGTLGVNGDVESLPTEYPVGWAYKIITAGRYAGKQCKVGDLILATKDGHGLGNPDSNWTVTKASPKAFKVLDSRKINKVIDNITDLDNTILDGNDTEDKELK